MSENMNQLLREQYRLLDFLEEQDTAVINGAAGTGKTMVAVEKARRHSINDESVLFLCYNRLLCDSLIERYKNNKDKAFSSQFANVDFSTVSQLAKDKVGNYMDYSGLLDWICGCDGDSEKFGYKHVIVDEGQDFGLIDADIGSDAGDAIESCSIIDALQEVVLGIGGTFYLFYDKYQMIEGSDGKEFHLPDCIQNCDCRLTLTKNCRNTFEIAKTSVTPLKNKKNKAIRPRVASSWYDPERPKMHLVQSGEESIAVLNKILDRYIDQGITDIVLLTPQKIEFSSIADHLIDGKGDDKGYYVYPYRHRSFRMTTSRKYKGLEATAVVMLDLKKNSFVGKKGMNFYVGTSRAKMYLDLICEIPAEDYFEVVHELDSNAPKKNDVDKMRKILGNTFAVDIVTQ